MMIYEKAQLAGDIGQAERLSKELRIPSVVAQILCVRGYDDIHSAKRFLYAGTKELHDPYLFEMMQDAADCIFAAGTMGAKICVYGDYDADGICSTAMLVRHLRSLDFDVIGYIPSRHDEGYGLNKKAIEHLAQQEVELIVTVDCGITAVEEIAYAYELGMEVVLTDHHQCPPQLPECEAIINPARNEEPYPYSDLCGAGVVLKMITAMSGTEAAQAYFDLAAIATVADIVNLTGENRIIVREGIKRINQGHCCAGVKALMDVCGLKNVDTQSLGFGLGPRINAAGRMGSAQYSLDLLLSDDPKEVRRFAKILDDQNAQRQQLELSIINEIEVMTRQGQLDLVRDPVIMLCNPEWNTGVIGIAASRLAKRYYRPTILFGGEDGCLTASGRSIPGINLHETLSEFRDQFERFGGHSMAAGLTIKEENYDAFRNHYQDYIRQNFPQDTFIPRSDYDLEISPKDITMELAEQLEQLAPFGTGNQAPRFYVENACLQKIRTMGKDQKHIRFCLNDHDREIGCVAFNEGHRAASLRCMPQDLLINVGVNSFAGKQNLQCMIKSMRDSIPKNSKQYIQDQAWKFYNAFYDRIGYNSSTTFHVYDETSEMLNESQCRKELLEYSQSPQGALIISMTPQGATELLECLKQTSCGNWDIAWHTHEDLCAYNCIVFAPYLPGCDFSQYKKILLWDGVWRQEDLQVLRASGAAVQIRSCKEAKFLTQAGFSREEMIPAYRMISAQARNRTQFLDIDEYVSLLTSQHAKADANQIAFALHVFKQLSLLQVNKEGCFEVKACPTLMKRDLAQSSVYTICRQLREQFAAASGE